MEKESPEPDIEDWAHSFDPKEHTKLFRRKLGCIEHRNDSTLLPSGSRLGRVPFLPDQVYRNLCYGFSDLPETFKGDLATGLSTSGSQALDLYSPWAPSILAGIANRKLPIFHSFANVSNFRKYLNSVQGNESTLAPSCSRQVDQVREVSCLGLCDLEEGQHGCYNSGPSSLSRAPMKAVEETGKSWLKYAQENDETCLDDMLLGSARDSQCDPQHDESFQQASVEDDDCLLAVSQADSWLPGDVATATDERKACPSESMRNLWGKTTSFPQDSILPVVDKAELTSGYGTSDALAEPGNALVPQTPTSCKMNSPSAIQAFEGSGESTEEALREGKGRPLPFVRVTDMLIPDKLAENDDSSDDSV